MTSIMLFVTLFCISIPIYVYIVYPVVLFILSMIRKPLPVDKAKITPSVALLVSCYNEEKVIEEKINNCLKINYPKDKIDIIFISDGSDDATDQIIERYQVQGIRLIRQEGRLGKTSGLNLAIPQTNAEIIVFSDANAIYALDAIKMLVRNFNDPRIGYVVGAALYTDSHESSAAKNENNYWKYEMAIKKLESNLHSVVGGDGAIYAIRSYLYEPLDKQDINDFVNPLQIILKGYRGIFEPDAQAYEETAGNYKNEAKRKERIVNRSFRGLLKVRSVMNPFKTGFFSFEIISHKLLRWLIPFFMLICGLGIIYLSQQGYILFQVLLLISIVFCWISFTGYILSGLPRLSPIFSYPYYFMSINISALSGILQAIKGNIQVTWDSSRTITSPSTNPYNANLVLAIALLVSICLFLSTMRNMFSILF